MNQNNIEHRHTTPLWPQANGETERQNRTLVKALKIARAEKKSRPMKRELNKFLLAYRSTPHQTTGTTPAELMFKRKIRTKLPELDSMLKAEVDESIRDCDQLHKEKGNTTLHIRPATTQRVGRVLCVLSRLAGRGV